MTACSVGAAGVVLPVSVVCRIGYATRLPTAAATSAFASPFSSHFLFSAEYGLERTAWSSSPSANKNPFHPARSAMSLH